MRNSFKEWIAKQKNESAVSDNQQAKRKQRHLLTLLGIVCLAFLLCALFYQTNSKDVETTPRIRQQPSQVITVDSPLNGIGSKDEWVEKAQVELVEQKQLTNRLSDMATTSLQTQQQLQKTTEEQTTNIDELVVKIATLEETIEQLKAEKSVNRDNPREDFPSQAVPVKPMTTVQIYQIPLIAVKAARSLRKTPRHYIPLGSHVTAILIGGVDVSAAVTASSNPRVVYMRTQGKVRLPGNKATPLSNCYLLGSSWGDVSSERAYVRLARMSCEQHGVSVEYDVKGNVFGPDGREGIRGKVVMRDGALVGRAFLGGLISGLGDTYSGNYTTTSTSALGSVQSVNNHAALQYGIGQGMQKAADMYADYNIRRAEQYQPVIEISAGTVADLVFAEGFYIDGEVANDEDSAASAESANATASPLVNTALQMQAMSATNPTSQNTNTFP